MAKSKFIAIAASAAFAAMLGLSACSAPAGNSASASASSSAAESSAAASSAVESSAAADAPSSAAAAADADATISWAGALSDGTVVDYISSDDGMNGGLVLEKSGSEPMRWLGAMTTSPDGKQTITDDNTKETITFTLEEAEGGAQKIDIEGYGQGAIVALTAADWAKIAEAEELKKNLETPVNWLGAFEDGSLVVYMDTPDHTEAALVIGTISDPASKTWTGKVTSEADNKVTITDDTTKESITFTITKSEEEGGLIIENDQHGKGFLVQMTYADWMSLNEL